MKSPPSVRASLLAPAANSSLTARAWPFPAANSSADDPSSARRGEMPSKRPAQHRAASRGPGAETRGTHLAHDARRMVPAVPRLTKACLSRAGPLSETQSRLGSVP